MTTPRDPLATALREALEAERPAAGDDALIARAIARASTTLAAPAAKAAASSTSADSSSKVAASNVTTNATEPTRVLSISRPRTRVLRVALPLAAAFAASMAMAGVYMSSRTVEPMPAPAIEAPEAPAPAEAPAQITKNLPAEIPNTEPSVSVDDLPSAKPLAAVTSDTVSFSPPPPPADSPVTAAELFRDANAERRAGNIGKSIDLYRSLQKRYPDAPETQASRVSLGRLLLDRRSDASGALAQFDAYLKGSPADGGTLAEEARVGRALAFEKLGRLDDERRAWEELLSRHPQSLHSGRARERLSILSGTRDTPIP